MASISEPRPVGQPRLLRGRVAVVTGASRGTGKAIAVALGAAGATVYVTGRSRRTGATTENLPGTIDDTAELVTSAGGTGIAVGCDHTRDDEVATLFQRVHADHGRLDLLVNNAWGGYEGHAVDTFTAPFWEQDLAARWHGMFVAGVRAQLVTSRSAIPLMLPQGGGLIVGTVAWAFDKYLGNLYYDMAKAATIRMAFGMAQELWPHGIAAVALTPGFVRTERVMAAHAAQPFDLSSTESPEYIGQAVVALAADTDVFGKSGRLLTAGDLAREYGFTDVDGGQPAPFTLPDTGG